jgi:uncharacterized protein (TIGR03435 family)
MLKSRLLGAVGIVAVVGGIAGLRAVQQAPDSPVFTVASIKPNASGAPGQLNQIFPGGRYTATNLSLLALIRVAYRLQSFQLVGAPSWLGTEHFDIVAKADGDLFPSDMASSAPRPLELALRKLLADRFQLVAHMETRQLPIYALVLSRADGRLGPKLTRSSTDCAALVEAARAGATRPPPAPGQAPPCGAAMGRGRLFEDSISLSLLPSLLAPSLDRMIVDRTGLTGAFNLDLTWQPDQPLPGSPGADAAAADPNAPSIFTALQEQLGLKLESTRGPVDVLVIDHVDHPTED